VKSCDQARSPGPTLPAALRLSIPQEPYVIYVLASVAFSVLVSVLLKLARRFAVDVPQAIAWNYLAAGALIAWLWRPSLAPLRSPGAPWFALLGLGVLLPSVFVALGASVRHAGIVRSDAAQRLSLLVSLVAAFAFFGEALSARKAAGVALGFAALAAMIPRRRAEAAAVPGPAGAAAWLYPLAVFAGFGAIDILLKQVAQSGTGFAAALLAAFALSFVLALLAQGWRRWRHGTRLSGRSAAGGLLLGLANAGNILCYVRGHQALPQQPALVFGAMNLGVVALGALVGTVAFRERLGLLNLAGLVLAAAAIVLLAA
jgi:drug/metabolite transporter (DMT)-like permease